MLGKEGIAARMGPLLAWVLSEVGFISFTTYEKWDATRWGQVRTDVPKSD